MSECLSENLLLAFAQRALSGDELGCVHQHIDQCESCRLMVAEAVHAMTDAGPLGPPDSPHQPDPPSFLPSANLPFELAEVQTIDEYRLLRVLGRGAMGCVYLARDQLLERFVAIKMISPKRSDPKAPSRFLLEARAIARLQHPNVVSVYRVGQLGGQAYLVCEYVEGQTLDQVELPLPWPQVVSLAREITRGLSAAHRSGVLHRDIKPSNVIVSKTGHVKLLDFGLAKIFATPLESDAVDPQPYDNEQVGTPAYMAPEVFRGEVAGVRADIYSLGALLYSLCVGRPPFSAASLNELRQQVLFGEYAALCQVAGSVDPRLGAIVDRCLQRDPEQRYADVDELAGALAIITEPEEAIVPGGNPYRGLLPFESEHRALFFGRSEEIAAVVDLLRNRTIVAVVGESGVGKSSLCRAGVLPLFADGTADSRVSWDLVCVVPGQRPGHALADGLAKVAAGPASRGLLIFIDQAEELVTTADAQEAKACVATLGRIVQERPQVRILLTIRADRLPQLSLLVDPSGELSRGIFLLQPLRATGLREVVVRPARLRGYVFETEDLVQELVRDTLSAQGGLPLLSFALAELWDARENKNGRLTIPATALSEKGGVVGALARHADAVIANLTFDARHAARRILRRLVSVDGLRIARAEDELRRMGRAAELALSELVRGRLLVVRNTDHGCTVEIAHEALVQGWDTLRTWLLEEREARALLQRVETAAREWERLDRAVDALWGRRQLLEAAPALALLEAPELGELSERERLFLAASRRAGRLRRLRQISLLGGVPLLALLSYVVISYRLHRNVMEQVATQLRQAEDALSQGRAGRQRIDALRATAFSLFDRGDRLGGEQKWAQFIRDASNVDEDLGKASRALELGQLLAPQNALVKERFASVLLERALLAEALHLTRLFEDLRYRLALYDGGGARSELLDAAAELQLVGLPADAQATLAAVVRGPSLLWRAGDAHALPRAGKVSLPPGSYLLTLIRPAAPHVRLPLRLQRGEHLSLTADIPSATEVPAGMIWIPAGRFLYGSAADESARRGFLRADPLHERRTDAYFIARYETTYADWLDYLRHLDPQERAQRLPRAGTSFQGGLGLQEAPDGTYILSFQAGPVSYHAGEGQLLRYEQRRHRAIQNWLRFPVTGISFDDAQAYAAWLDKSGRIPGARLCSEEEWERAARGADERDYPHGDRLLPDDANYDETYGKEPRAFGPDEVGSHPASRSPFGVEDMAGNALEWVSSTVARHGCATRGGAYYYGDLTCRLNNRSEWERSLRNATQGMRLCATYHKPRVQ